MNEWKFQFVHFVEWSTWGLGFQVIVDPNFLVELTIIVGPVVLNIGFEKDIWTSDNLESGDEDE